MSHSQDIIIFREEDERMAVLIEIDGHPFVAILDTGSTRSLICLKAANQVMTNVNRLEVQVAMTMANGTIAIASLALAVKVQLGETQANIEMLVLPDVIDNIILGMDFLRVTRSVLQIGNTRIPLGSLPSVSDPETNDEAEGFPEETVSIGAASASSAVETNGEVTTSTENSSFDQAPAVSSINAYGDVVFEPGPDWLVAPADWRVDTAERLLPNMIIRTISAFIAMGIPQDRHIESTVDDYNFKIVLPANGEVYVHHSCRGSQED